MGAARRKSSKAVRICSPFLASDSLSADWHFLFLSPHGGTGLPTASAFTCLHFQTPRDRLTSFVSCSSQILGENSDWSVWIGCPLLDQWAVPRARPVVPTCRPHGGHTQVVGTYVGGAGRGPLGSGDRFPEMRLVLGLQNNRGLLHFSTEIKGK